MGIKLNRPIAELIKHLPRMAGVYVIRNVLNGKCYVGSSANIRKRAWVHMNHLRRSKHHNSHLQNAWNLYGDDLFVFLVAELCDESMLLALEREWMERLNSCSDRDGYNLISDPVRHSVSDETRQKMRQSSPLRGKPAFNRGIKLSDEARRRLSEANRGRVKSATERAKLSAAMLGPAHPHRGKILPLATRRNMSAGQHVSGPKVGRFKGVNKDKRTAKFMARIYVDGRYRFLGRYESEEDAARAYNNAAMGHWGGDCYLNDVVPGVPTRNRTIGRLSHAS